MKESLIDKLYTATNGGLDIIYSYYPQARECEGKAKKFFRIREGDKTPSASLKEFKGKWCVTDFGDDGTALNAIEVCMREERLDFREALHLLANRYEVSASYVSESNKAKVEARPAMDDEENGSFSYIAKDEMSDFELKILGPKVTNLTVKRYAYVALVSYTSVKEGKTTTVSSTDEFPIFLRECEGFQKIYQPLNWNKAFRFFYKGSKPKDYINGMAELEAAWKKLVAKSEEEEDAEFYEGGKKKSEIEARPKKLDCAIFCSGERDALNVAGMGYYPLWLNSESARVREDQMGQILKMVDKVYNIPDLDDTGEKRGVEFALEHLDIYTVQLPSWLSNYRDHRGKPRKDLRDYLDIKESKKDFEGLLRVAKSCKFWKPVPSKDGFRIEIKSLFFLWFLQCNGFGRVVDEKTGFTQYCKVDKHIVNCVRDGQLIKDFVREFFDAKRIETDVQELFINSQKTSLTMLDNMKSMQLDFVDYTKESQQLFFNNKVIEVFRDRVVDLPVGVTKVWDDDICKCNFKRLPRSFEWEYMPGEGYQVELKSTASHYLRVLMQASRMFWADEVATLEDEDRVAYMQENRFNIASPRLDDYQVEEQMQHLMNKMYVIGYLLHRYKDYSRALSVWVMENKITEDSESSGGSGKSFMIGFLKKLMNMVTLPGRDKKLTDNQFFMDRVEQQTRIIYIDDAQKYFDFNAFYSFITGDMVVNRKNKNSFEIDFKKSAKLVISSNFPPMQDDGSTMRRLLMCVFSDYYHKQTNTSVYKEDRSIVDDFGYELYDEKYKPEWMNEDVNFCVDCLQFYLDANARGVVVHPPIDKVQVRITRSQIGEDFIEWADVYFSPISGNLDVELNKDYVFEEFLKQSGKSMKITTWKKKLQLYCTLPNHIACFNPPELCDGTGKRIVKKDYTGKTQEYIYLRRVVDSGDLDVVV